MVKYVENIVVGDGIMAKQLVFVLKDKFSDLLCVSSLDFAPPCSLTSTALNCLRGTQRGVSDLGDLICDAHEEFELFVQKHNPPGITKTKEIQTWIEHGPKHAKWLRRYGDYNLISKIPFKLEDNCSPLAVVSVDAYVLDTNILFKWYEDQNKDVQKKNDFILKVEKLSNGYRIHCKSGDVLECKRLYLCTSFMSSNFTELCKREDHKIALSKHKKVYGNYLQYKIKANEFCGLDLNHSFCLSFNFLRLIYRKDSNEFLLSIDDTNKDSFIFDKSILETEFSAFVKTLELKSFPSFSDWQIKSGIRSKGFRRMPFCEELNQGLFMCTGLYKNAFTFAFLMSKKLINS